MKKLKIKRIIIMLLIIVSLYGFIQYNNYINSNPYKLNKLGYPKEEIKIILAKLNKDQVNIIIKKEEYIDQLALFLNEKYFIFDKLDRYVAYSEKNIKGPSDVIAIINTNNDYPFYEHLIETKITKDSLMLVNKFNHLSQTYAPDDIVDMSLTYSYSGNSVREETYNAFINMWQAAKDDGVSLIANSTYRTYAYQDQLYKKEIAANGQIAADNYVARPGHSEHQTGFALDISEYRSSDDDFAKTDAYAWLTENCYKYGFILRYPEGKEYLTGYKFESWHYRYIGINDATKLHGLGITFDEYYAYYLDR